MAVQVAFEALLEKHGSNAGTDFSEHSSFLFSALVCKEEKEYVHVNDPRTGAEIDPSHHSAVMIFRTPVQPAGDNKLHSRYHVLLVRGLF